ncbi:hypothetical protein Y032_0019g3812 [Ancylostoma ceylanicum]|uniref:Uncharacterized protein n=1 Tax=Ancylostoma ceylanicum TaxID=53326 RepID=A0A016V3W7_9BILA|nr:hypothetical protein Y032_0019g3812 [Ancylostoma ceylanicum]
MSFWFLFLFAYNFLQIFTFLLVWSMVLLMIFCLIAYFVYNRCPQNGLAFAVGVSTLTTSKLQTAVDKGSRRGVLGQRCRGSACSLWLSLPKNAAPLSRRLSRTV